MQIELTESPEQIKKLFLGLQSRIDVANLLEVPKNKLNYHLYVLQPRKRYTVFYIDKKSGGQRKITAPISPIKILQRKLNKILETVFTPKSCTHGFVRNKNIISNARVHQKKRVVFNLDLKDFFPSIHFGRVRGLFMGIPYNLNQEVSTILAQICCHEGLLPQGAPTSPIISNMICAKLDSDLKVLARENQCVYSRYADDLTFSTNKLKFPSSIAHLSENGPPDIGGELTKIIEDNGFKVNFEKSRLQFRYQRQEVTGLVVNRYVNINRKYLKKLRAILFAWKKDGIDSVSQRYFEKFARKQYPGENKNGELFKKVIKGKIEYIGMVKGKANHTFLSFQKSFYSLAPELKSKTKYIYTETTPIVYTEGKTDKKHLSAALAYFKSKGTYLDLNIDFPLHDEPVGGPTLLKQMEFEQKRLIPNDRPHIFIFDRDDKDVLYKLNQVDEYRERENKVFSLILPIPPHRENLSEICIEFYYFDKDLFSRDENGRRLFLSSEFDSVTGEHLKEKVKCKNANKIRGFPKIVSEEVHDVKGASVALTKRDFAENIFQKKKRFDEVDFSGFELLFGKIAEIVNIFDSQYK